MDLVPCNEKGREQLAANLFEVGEDGLVERKTALYVASTFPSILPDVARYLIEQSIQKARESGDNPTLATKYQLKPYFMFAFLLGKSPQISGLMYSYFENSSFQPLPENLFNTNSVDKVLTTEYKIEGFNDYLVKEILHAYYKYLTYNPKWFSAIWNWGELGRLMTIHISKEIRYLAACCLSAITRPSRLQHINFMRDTLGNASYQLLIDYQISNRRIHDNTFRPCIETNREKADQYVNAPRMYFKGSEYPYCQESLAKVSNILLIKRDLSIENGSSEDILVRSQKVTKNYIPVATLQDAISRIAYSISINRPCIIRGSTGGGKTAILDYIAAKTNRVNPPDYVKVQIGDQIDSKLLIGSYVCTEIPGQFEWQPGPLSKAMDYGSWIVFEDIDAAPPEMAQVIHSVIENGNLTCVSCCPIKLDRPHPDFRIMFTQKLRQSNSTKSSCLGSGFIERLCDIVEIPTLTEDDTKDILHQIYNFGDTFKQTIYQLFMTSKTLIGQCKINRATRSITMRDLIKFSDRLKDQKIKTNSEGTISSSEQDTLLLDAVDCFLASLPQDELKRAAEDIGPLLNKSANAIHSQLIARRPEIRIGASEINVGRAVIPIYTNSTVPDARSTLAHTQQSLQLMESVSLCIKYREPVLLVGETGVGKTSIVQHIANLIKANLVVINLSQQSDSSDLLGGFKPVGMKEVMAPYHNKFVELFRKTYDENVNTSFLQHVENCFESARTSSKWQEYLKVVSQLCAKALDKTLPDVLSRSWRELQLKTARLSKRMMSEKEASTMALTFSKGSLLKAVKDGSWILLDEINLAEPDVLQCLVLLLDSLKTSQVYMNIPGESEDAIKINPSFRIFACMNPATDIGKRELAMGTRGRFTEFFVDDVKDRQDLRLIVESYVKTCLTPKQIESIVNFYVEIRERSNVLSDISGNAPIYSLRTLCRALQICSANVCNNMEKSLYESLKITFLQQLNEASILQVLCMMKTYVFGREVVDRLERVPVPMPKDDRHQYIEIEGFWIQRSNQEIDEDSKYIITKSIKRNLQSLSRIISLGQRKLPILIQGNTSVGKTSLIKHMAKISGNKCYRINNHEHTDLQEYFGRHVLKESGELVFKKGLLVRAMEKGYWIILDELNLAPTELLEALNRALDDNRELFIPELGTTIKAHSKFVLFATQNPPEEYAGRKILSRAFRNRFVELHFDDIPSDELEVILEKRCEMAPKHAQKIVSVMKELQIHRRESGCFNGRNSFMTLRDLFRWGERYAIFNKRITDGGLHDWEQYLAEEGLVLLEGRVRTMNEADTVKKIIEKVFKRQLLREKIYNQVEINSVDLPVQFRHIFFTKEFKRLFVQLVLAMKYNEPILLCGQTGCGKTTACQIYAAMKGQELITYNCHLNTESSDFVGSVRPSRQNIDSEDGSSKQTFPWIDGPLIEAMKAGAVFLLDEISLADDAVLERLNSVLEPDRSIALTEKNGEEIIANDNFRIVATMNPGGDYGKKELSPALRNRFTEIYCHNTIDVDQIMMIIQSSLSPHLLKPRIAPHLHSVMKDFLEQHLATRDNISIRDVLSWTQFLNKTTLVNQSRPLTLQEGLINGASLVFFDQFGTSGFKSINSSSNDELKKQLRNRLKSICFKEFGQKPFHSDNLPAYPIIDNDIVRFKKFHLTKGPKPILDEVQREFVIDAPTVRTNLMKIVRAMQLDRPILLEGDPGAGKTSVVSALAKLTGHNLIRINLSEQTDISDLFGSDLPDTSNPDDDNPRFSWHDGPILGAIKESNWVLLDEMNLASQSVLEGLNACFDHRGEIYIPELNKRVQVNKSATRFFACQNPYSQGASRKGLPQSFLNRFTSIYIEPHTDEDLLHIIKSLYPKVSDSMIRKMILFNRQVSEQLKYSGFEFNLRDILYWCELTTRYAISPGVDNLDLHKPEKFVQFVYLDRLRTTAEQSDISELFQAIFDKPVYEPPYREIRLGEQAFIIARSVLPRRIRMPQLLSQMTILKYQLPYIESISKALEYNKMPILVGEAGVGKRSMIRIIAGLTGNELNIVGANRDMDTVELLGSFEQKSLQREIIELIDESKDFVTELINSISDKPSASNWTQVFKRVWIILYSTALRDLNLSKSALADALRFQLIEMKDLITKLSPLAPTNIEDNCKDLNAKIDRIMKKFLYDCDSMYSVGNFEWIDSILIKSIRLGHWLMIENANLLNPATLDRLNSLVENNGSLSLNEKGAGPDGIEILKPHPAFRLILTMSPEHGELSRAMRNRGVEIFIQPTFYFEDFLMLLYQNGFEPRPQRPCMSYSIMETCVEAHYKITNEAAYEHESGNILSYFALNCIPTLTHQIRRGSNIDSILTELLVAHYNQKGYSENCNHEILLPFVREKMAENCKKYEVNLHDERYQWIYLIHDLVSLCGGDANTAMLERDHQLFFDNAAIETYLKPDEIVENFDIVSTCTTIKVFLELSTHGDFDYRKGFIKETFANCPNLITIVDKITDQLYHENIHQIGGLLPRSNLVPFREICVDSRNSPDLHYYLMLRDYAAMKDLEDYQNRWLLSLQKSTLSMTIEMIEQKTKEKRGYASLWSMSEMVRLDTLLKEDLLRPVAEIAVNIYDLLNGLLMTVSNRLISNEIVGKMMSKFFWIQYFICKLRKSYNKHELICLCNQLPMLWALTYQKVIVPIIQDFNLADLVYSNKKFSNRIKDICDFLDITVSKPCKVEKAYYNKVFNSFAWTVKISENIGREMDKLFFGLLQKYSGNPQKSHLLIPEYTNNISASNFVWSDSTFSQAFYKIADKLVEGEIEDRNLEVIKSTISDTYKEAKDMLVKKNEEYALHQVNYQVSDGAYKTKCIALSRRNNGLVQYAPIWQLMFIQHRLSLIDPDLGDPIKFMDTVQEILANVCGLILSPRYYATIARVLARLKERQINPNYAMELGESRLLRENLDLYSVYLLDHLIENVVFDNLVVGWTKMRVTTCDLPTSAPIVPEYSPMNSLVASYCLDANHLKLNSHEPEGLQLNSLLSYLWRSYSVVKLNLEDDVNDIDLAKRLLHLRCQTYSREEFVGSYQCEGPDNRCNCIDAFINRRTPTYEKLLNTIKANTSGQDAHYMVKAMRLIYFGYMNYLEYAPIFTLDPSLKNREMLEVYKSELAHIKLELHLKNILYYWKTGENLCLDEEPENLHQYPFSMRLLVERRIKLEAKVARLKRENSNRPKSDDGAQYNELRKDVEVCIERFRSNIQTLMNAIIDYLNMRSQGKLSNINSKCRMLIKSFDTSINRFRSEFALYGDLTTNFLVGLCFIRQGLRCLYSRFELRMQIVDLEFRSITTENFAKDIMQVFSFSALELGNLQSVSRKLKMFPQLEKLCPRDRLNNIQSIVLKTVLIQLNYHIAITPSDIQQCIPVVHNIANLFTAAWSRRKQYLEEQRKQKEDIYQYKNSKSTLGNQVPYERQEFLDICAKFPLYDYLFKSFQSPDSMPSAEEENLNTEEKIVNLNQSVDLSMCIDICKAHYKFTMEASRNLLGQLDTDKSGLLSKIDMRKIVELESEVLYTIVRRCILALDKSFDSVSAECHILQAYNLCKVLSKKEEHLESPGDIKSSLLILDEKYFDIYHDNCPSEVLKLQTYIRKLEKRIFTIQEKYQHAVLTEISNLTAKLSSFLITDPLMKFITGSHALLAKLETWQSRSKKETAELVAACGSDQKLTSEISELIELLKSWRTIEIASWRSSLHRVKQKYIDDSLCALWFYLYEAFNDPIARVRDILRQNLDDETFELGIEHEHLLYEGFASIIKNFFEEEATMGDFQIRLDLVFAFAIQTRFASQSETNSSSELQANCLKVDYEKLTTYVYNVHRHYAALLEPLIGALQEEEATLIKELNAEIRIVSWQGRNLWEIKNNFRLSHRKLNKVMNKYLEILKRPLPSIASHFKLKEAINKEDNIVIVDQLSETLTNIYSQIDRVSTTLKLDQSSNDSLIALKDAEKVVRKFKHLNKSVHEPLKERYLSQLESIEQTIISNSDAIKNFYSHRVQDVVINPKDTKESKAEKHKLCRQMYHSKNYAMQSIFKNLQSLGVSYQRGLNSAEVIDRQILSLEPLRGMIRNQSKTVLTATTNLVNDETIAACNDMYRDLIARFTFLMADQTTEHLTSDQTSRMHGIAMDFLRDINIQVRDAGLLYKDLIDIQASATRLDQLHDSANSQSTVTFNFKKVHKIVMQFNEIVGRSVLALTKLEEMCACYETMQQNNNTNVLKSTQPIGLVPEELSEVKRESYQLRTLTQEMDESHALMTDQQYNHIKKFLLQSRTHISGICDSLRDMLNHTIRNHLYGEDDLQCLRKLYDEFVVTFASLIPDEIVNSNMTNCKPGTLLGSLIGLIKEAETNLKPNLEFRGSKVLKIQDQSNFHKLNLRLHKLVRQSKLAVQDIFKNETNFANDSDKFMSETTRRQNKPFNSIDSRAIRKMLRSQLIGRHIGNCFMTLNGESNCQDIKPFVAKLTPLLSIYIRDVACYINIILASMQLKLGAATKLYSFFIDLKLNGMGLPYKAVEDDSKNGTKSNKCSDDNTGFGEGQGDTDVSKKLEFESQLDDLKKDDEKKEGEEKEEEPVEAHDDGVEMSEDIDAQAKGAEDKDPDDLNKPEDEQEEGDDQNLDDLDKELDQVDESEGNLDENLWDEKDEKLFGDEEDDEKDLRETSEDTSGQSKQDDKEMQAKDDHLQESKSSGEKKAEDDTNEAPKDENTGDVGNQNKGDEETEDEDEDEEIIVDDSNDLDMQDEADQAQQQRNQDLQEIVDDVQNELKKVDDEIMDMSLSDDDLDSNKSGDKMAEDQKSEGELSEGDQSPINDEEIDKQLEDVDEKLTEEQARNPLDEQISNLINNANQESGREMQGTAIGRHKVYDIIAEEPNDPIDYDENQTEEDRVDDEKVNDQATTSGVSSKEQPESGSMGKDVSMQESGDNNDNDPQDKNKESIDEDPDANLPNKPSKRAFAEHDEKNEDKSTKRQKILEANSDEANDKEKNENKEKSSDEVRHVDKESATEIECIDLCSSQEDDILEIEQQLNVDNDNTKLEPKLGEQSNSTVDNVKDTAENSKPELEIEESTSDDIIDVENSIEEGADKEKEGSMSSISSANTDDFHETLESVEHTSLSMNDASSYITNYGLLRHIALRDTFTDKEKLEGAEVRSLLEKIDKTLTTGQNINDMPRETRNLLLKNWSQCTKSIDRLVHELNHQLQIVLQPTKMSKYKGDYKSGKRLNMRKIISYIASHYRKDKIWLRRTKPAKRTYNICLAVDNSSSMSENNCRLMTYQSLALLAKSLSLIEVGSLSVVSFGEQVRCIHEFGQAYDVETGARWLNELRFNENKTQYRRLLQYSCQSFAKQAQNSQSASEVNPSGVNQLLIIISDGRNVTSEEEDVKLYLRQLKSQGVLTLFLIIDDLNRNRGNSIVDIKRPIGLGSNLRMLSYMELFPFPFYVLLRQLDSMPSVLGDALRQWFELVSGNMS